MDKLTIKEFIAAHPFFVEFSPQNIDDLLPIIEAVEDVAPN